MQLRNSTTPNFSDRRRRRRSSNVPLPLKLSSDRRETSVTRVSEDLQIWIFRRQKTFFDKMFMIRVAMGDVNFKIVPEASVFRGDAYFDGPGAQKYHF